jgi:hypothetical protein
MMKPDIDTEKYSGHNSGNNTFIKTFSDPGNMKISLKMALTGAIVQGIDFPEMNIDLTTYVPDDIKKKFHITLCHPPTTLLHPRSVHCHP